MHKYQNTEKIGTIVSGSVERAEPMKKIYNGD